MKKNYISSILLAIVILVFTTAASQNVIPKQEPYWVVESNLKNPRQSIVYFYNEANQLIGKQEVSGKKINVNRARVRTKLDQLLKEINTARQNNPLLRDSIVVANRF